MSINRGKQFEDNLKKQFEKVPDTLCLRLYDVTTGYKNQNNICDFIVFNRGTLNLLECKAIHGNTLNFKSHIRDNQWDGLLKSSYIPGVNAGILCWFMDWDITVFLPIEYLQYMLEDGYKSFNIRKDINKIPRIILDGVKKRVFFDYDLEKFLEGMRYE